MVISYILNKGVELVGKKWRIVVVWHLRNGSLRFSELKRLIPDVSVKVLSEVLQEMEQNRIITRTQYNTIPVKVVYSLHVDAEEFVERYTSTAIVMGAFLLKNQESLNIPMDMADRISQFLEEHDDGLN